MAVEPCVAVVIPCWNEELTIAKVVQNFQQTLPLASIHVFDNNSADESPRLAREAGGIIHQVHQQGKGFVVRAIFEEIKADIVILVDGDNTYFAEDAPSMLKAMMENKADMVVGNRLENIKKDALKPIRRIGNIMIRAAIERLLGKSCHDALSGYRTFSRRFVETVKLTARGFEIETELTIRAAKEHMVVVEVPVSYRSRPPGSYSKLSSIPDGLHILLTVIALWSEYHLRPVSRRIKSNS